MTGISTALKVESLKFRLAPVVWVATFAVLALVPLLSVGAYGLVGSDAHSPSADKFRATMIGHGWEAIYSLATQVGGVAVLLGVGIVASWCLGREFTEQTVVGLFAQPVPRAQIALAKVSVTLLWALGLSVAVALLVLLGGTLQALTLSEGVRGALKLSALGVLMSLGALPAAWVASVARGYLPGIGAVLGIVILSQLATAFGGGAWVPWAAPVLWAGAAGKVAAEQITVPQLLLPALLGAGFSAALCWWWGQAELGNSR